MRKKYLLIFAFIFSILPFRSVFANVSISEIMYDVSGSDSGREWIEVYNDASSAVDVSDWRLFEADTNHALTIAKGEAQIPASGYVIIAENPEKFLIDWPNFSGAIFDSSFSLSNTGETLALKDKDLNVVDAATYDSSSGANGDGNSLNRKSADWASLNPSPGSAASNQNNIASDSSVPAKASSKSTKNITPAISAEIIYPQNIFVGESIDLESKILSADGQVLGTGKYFWNFGNGETKTFVGDQKFKYQYDYPGEYVVVLSYFENDSSAKPLVSTRAVIKAISPQVSISASRQKDSQGVENLFIDLSNASSDEIDLSSWVLRSGSKEFTIPDGSVILPLKRIFIKSSLAGFTDQDLSDLKLYYPGGQLVKNYSGEIFNQKIEQKTDVVLKNNGKEKTNALAEPVATAKDSANSNNSNLTASALGGFENKNENNSILIWILALIGLIALSVISFFLMKKPATGENVSDAKDESEDFEII